MGLSPDALIIPSDVHDYLVDRGLIAQDMFVGVCGGNFLEEEHVEAFLKMLEVGDAAGADVKEEGEEEDDGGDGKKVEETRGGDNKKVAAALFFHEHVISIIKMTVPQGPWYDLIDSMPTTSPTLLSLPSSSSSQNNGSSRNGNKKNGKTTTCTDVGASRIRCKDLDTLRATLRWYACEKFTDANCEYIDTHDWDDAFCDFDPRVFQAFVWGE